jgi:hypothetical protein
MAQSFKLSRRIARFRLPIATALMVSLVACNGDDTLNPVPSTTTTTGAEPADQVLTLTDDGVAAAPIAPTEAAVSFAGGIPMGTFAQPTSEFGSIYNGALRNIGTNRILSELSAIRSRGGKIVLMMAGSQPYYLNRDGTFSLSKWKERVNRYRNINLSSFINDGTIIAHYLIDEPYDAHNFGGKPVSGATLEEMAKYSKSIWPSLKTVVRAEPYEIKWSGTYRALDAAWAQYLARKGNVNDYLERNVSQAKQMGLGLVVGMNIVKGGTPNGTWMTPSEVEKYGSALLNTDYACAFISWQYNSDKLDNSAMRSAMSALRRKAENRGSRSCSGG